MQNTSLKLKRNYYHHFLVGFFVFMVSFLVSAVAASSLAPVSDSSAESKTTSNDKTGFYVTVTNSDDVNLSVDGTPVGQVAISSASTVNVKTNAPLGYKLYLSTTDDELRATDTSITQTFKPVTSTDLSSNINKWGFSLSGEDNSWLAVPEVTSGNESSGYLLSSSSVPNLPNGTNTDVYYGINANTTMPTGTYTTTVTYTAIAEGTEDIPLMQDFTLTECANMDMDTTTTLMDKRNGKSYTIVKARDGNCWMADNLSLYSQDENHLITISDADSNLPANTTITLPTSTDWNTNDYTNMRIHVADGTGDYADKTGEYYGEVYYNWCASLGKTNCNEGANVTVNQSICPKGWRLPVNGGTTVNKSWTKLLNAYSVTTGAQLLDSSNAAYILGIHKYYGTWGYVSVTERQQGEYGYFQSSTAPLDARAYAFTYDSAAVYPQLYHDKGNGFSVRCVYDAPTMQEFTTTDCANMATDTTKELLDYRNNKVYNIVKARDGNCWMADNLAIYNQQISSADSNLPEGTTITLPGSTNWTTDNHFNFRIHVATSPGYEGEVYYNWCNAVVLTGDNCESTSTQQQYNICPNGWTLPINGNTTTNKSLARLFNSYGITTGSGVLNQKTLGFYRSGYWDIHYGEYAQGVLGIFWSSTPYGGTKSYYSQFGEDVFALNINQTRSYGFSLRCVLK